MMEAELEHRGFFPPCFSFSLGLLIARNLCWLFLFSFLLFCFVFSLFHLNFAQGNLFLWFQNQHAYMKVYSVEKHLLPFCFSSTSLSQPIPNFIFPYKTSGRKCGKENHNKISQTTSWINFFLCSVFSKV